jgi:hypothetical protein
MSVAGGSAVGEERDAVTAWRKAESSQSLAVTSFAEKKWLWERAGRRTIWKASGALRYEAFA